jgi:hypothetical protein
MQRMRVETRHSGISFALAILLENLPQYGRRCQCLPRHRKFKTQDLQILFLLLLPRNTEGHSQEINVNLLWQASYCLQWLWKWEVLY